MGKIPESVLTAIIYATAIQPNHHQWRDAFVPTADDSRVTYKQMIRMFTPALSPDGNNRRKAELRVVAFWQDWLVEIAGEVCCVVYLGISEVLN